MTKGTYERTPEIREKISASLTGRTVDVHVRNPQRDNTHCKRGHAFNEENTYIMPGGERRGKRVCKPCRRIRLAAYRERNPEKVKAVTRNAHLKLVYGITQLEYDSLLTSQQYACAICEQKDNDGGRQLAVDHDHVTGVVRGLLCGRCNRAIGNLRDDPVLFQRAIEYLVPIAQR